MTKANNYFIYLTFTESRWKSFSLVDRIKYRIMVKLLPNSRLVITKGENNE